MGTYRAEAKTIIEAPAAAIYALLADYQEGHPAILPERYFKDLYIKSGGQGAGTELVVTMRVLGTTSVYHMVVSEPEPGHILQEEDQEAGVVTTFTVDPFDGDASSQVTITTVAQTKPGLAGQVEAWITRLIARHIYRVELAQLAQVMQQRTVAT